MVKKLSIIHLLYITATLIIFSASNGCTVQIAPQDNAAAKKSEQKTYSFNYSKKKSKKEVKQNVSEQKAPDTTVNVTDTAIKPGDIVWACFSDCNSFRSQWGQAKIVTMATEATNGEYEVQWLYNTHATATGSKKWVKNVILKWHRAKIDELKPGMVVLCGADNISYPGVVKEVFAYKNAVVVENFWSPTEKVWTDTWEGEYLGAVKVIENPVMKDPRVK